MRPKLSEEPIIRQAARAVLPEVLGWLGGLDDDSDEEDVLKDLTGAIRSADMDGFDGYSIANRLDRDRHWSPDSSLVDILDGVAHRMYLFHREAVRVWVKAEGITCPLAMGAKIEYKGHPAEIASVGSEHAQYTVFCEALGHVRNTGSTGTLGEIVNAEELA